MFGVQDYEFYFTFRACLWNAEDSLVAHKSLQFSVFAISLMFGVVLSVQKGEKIEIFFLGAVENLFPKGRGIGIAILWHHGKGTFSAVKLHHGKLHP